jgi:hypothetical protein
MLEWSVSKNIIFSYLKAKCDVRVNETLSTSFFPEMSAFSGFKSICKIPRLWQYEVPLRIYGISSCSTQNLSQLRTRCKLNNLFTFTMSWSLNLYDPASKSSLILKQKSSNTKHNLSSWKKTRCNLWINFVYILRVIGGQDLFSD